LQILAARFIFDRDAVVDAVKLGERKSKRVILRLGVFARRETNFLE